MTETKASKPPAESKMVTVEPVEGFYLNDVPAVTQQVTPERAKELVATGAFIVSKE